MIEHKHSKSLHLHTDQYLYAGVTVSAHLARIADNSLKKRHYYNKSIKNEGLKLSAVAMATGTHLGSNGASSTLWSLDPLVFRCLRSVQTGNIKMGVRILYMNVLDSVAVLLKMMMGTYRFTLLPSSSSLSRVSHNTLLRCESVLVQIAQFSSEILTATS